MQEEEVIYEDLQLSESTNDATVEEVVQVIEVTEVEAFEVEMDEAFPALGEIDALNHALLSNRELHDAHPITAITGLREELDSIEALKTIYSDKKGNADYYEWADGHALGENGVGYFVSLNKDVRTISICSGDDIFGVVVDSAAFVGGQDDVVRDAHYGLVATIGAVHVMCELDVAEGDYVVSNAQGWATKSDSGRGYKVVALHDINGVPHATINLNISADQIDLMGAELKDLDSRMDAAETNIVSAVNVANEAYKKAGEIDISNLEISNKVDNALGVVDRLEGDVTNMGEQVANSAVISAQAKAIAESAATSATSMKNEAVEKANEALADTARFRDELLLMDEGITEIENQITIVVHENSEQNTAIAGIRTEVTDHDAKINNLVSWQGDTNTAMARIEQKADANGAYIQSTVSNMDKYAVGPYSQAYGFTLEQAASVLEEGMIYVPTETKTGEKAETYNYTDTDGSTKTYTREFVKHYLYKWGKIGDRYGWITVDKNYTETTETNTSAQAVYFTTTVPAVSGNFGYWYTDGDTVTEGYEPYTLYKWESYVNEGGATQYHWVAVATLAGNSQNRAVSQIRQDANSIELDVTNVKGDLAGIKVWAGDDFTAIQDTVKWKSDNAEAVATTIQKASDSEAYIAQIASVKNEDGTINAAASIVTAVNNDTSGVTITADHINLQGSVTISDLDTNTANKLNNAIASTVIEYALSDSPTTAPTSAWNTTAPDWQDDKYMWQKTTITYNDANKEPTVTMTCIQGAKGKQGEAGADGQTPTIEVNDDGYWVIDGAATTIKAQGTDGTTPTISIDSNGYWVINGATTTVKAQGDNGVSVTGVVEQYCISTSQSTQPTTGWNQSFDTILTTYNTNRKDNPNTTYYIWSRNAVTYSNGAKTYSNATVQGASSFVASWCNVNEQTKIDGGNIATGTITANKIAANAITADKIDASAITADKIDASALKSKNYNPGTTAADKPLVPSSGYSKAGTFFDLSNGAIYAPYFHVTSSGKIGATEGEIGGFSMSSKRLYYGGSNVGFSGLCSGTDTAPSLVTDNTNSYVRFFAGLKKSGSNPTFTADTPEEQKPKFAVLHDGSLYASAAKLGTGTFGSPDSIFLGTTDMKGVGGFFEGDSTVADDGAVTRADDAIDNWRVTVGSNFGVTSSGSLYCNDIQAGGGYIGDFMISDGCLTSNNNNITLSPSYISIGSIKIAEDTDKKTTVITTSANLGSLTLKDSTGTTGIEMAKASDQKTTYRLEIDGMPYGDATTASGATGKGVPIQLTIYPQPTKHFSFKLYWSKYSPNAWSVDKETRGSIQVFARPLASVYNIGILDTDLKCDPFGDDYLGIGFDPTDAGNMARQPINHADHSWEIELTKTIEWPGNNIYITGSLLPTTNEEYTLGITDKAWKHVYANTYYGTNLAIQTMSSDIRIKNSVSALPIEYETFFDKMEPTRYKYNEGTSNRYHTGFIAQQLVSALDESGLTTQDFAGVFLDHPGEENECWYLRRDEFVALNTWQIQKLKARTAELEAKVAELEAKLTD